MALTVLCLPCAAAQAQVFIGGTEYGTTSSTESLAATFTTPDGGVTAGLYENLVEITVSGTGASDGTALNDAFYLLGPPPTHDPSSYQLTFGTTTLQPYAPPQDITNFIVYDLLAGQPVSAPYVPVYEADNSDSFIIDTGRITATNLHFGVGDGQFDDNSGSYQLLVTQLTAIPEPASFLALVVGLGGVAILRRRNRVWRTAGRHLRNVSPGNPECSRRVALHTPSPAQGASTVKISRLESFTTPRSRALGRGGETPLPGSDPCKY